MALKQLFFQRITKNRPGARGLAPRPPSVIRLSDTSLLFSESARNESQNAVI